MIETYPRTPDTYRSVRSGYESVTAQVTKGILRRRPQLLNHNLGGKLPPGVDTRRVLRLNASQSSGPYFVPRNRLPRGAKDPRMSLPNLELDASVLTVICEFAHENGLSIQDCVNEALRDWVSAVVISRQPTQPLAFERKRSRNMGAPGRVVSICGR